jgi:hypothetical protein
MCEGAKVAAGPDVVSGFSGALAGRSVHEDIEGRSSERGSFRYPL